MIFVTVGTHEQPFNRLDVYKRQAQDGLQEAGCPGKPWMAGKTCGGTGIKSPG